MRFTLVFFPAILAFSSASSAEDPLVLWRDLQQGDTPETVAEKLATHPSIKRAKAKTGQKPSVAVSYRGEGIDILGQSFRLVLDFEGNALRQVSMGTDKVCANDSVPMFTNMLQALSEKYPDYLEPAGEPTSIELRKAFLQGTDENPQTVGRYLTDGKIVVSYLQQFTAEAAPPSGYTSSSAINALSRLLRNQYQARVQECDGTGDHRVRHLLAYLPREQFDHMLQNLKDGDREEIEAAKENL